MASDSILNIKVGVEFVDVKETYNYKRDLYCSCRLNNYKPQVGDRVAIFLAGWTHVKDYAIFQWVPVGHIVSDSFSVGFNSIVLPRNTTDLYQFCYITGTNEVQAASSTFQFSESDKAPSTNPMPISDPNSKEARFNRALDMLKESIEAIRSSFCNEESVNELKETVAQLQSTVSAQDREIKKLRAKIKEGSEIYKKIYIEKCLIEKKYKKLINLDKSDKKVINTEKTVSVAGLGDESTKKLTKISAFNTLEEDLNCSIQELESMPPFPEFPTCFSF